MGAVDELSTGRLVTCLKGWFGVGEVSPKSPRKFRFRIIRICPDQNHGGVSPTSHGKSLDFLPRKTEQFQPRRVGWILRDIMT